LSIGLLLPYPFASDLGGISDPQLDLQLTHQPLEPAPVSTGLHTYSHLGRAAHEFAVKALGFFRMLEAPLLQLSRLRVHHCDLLKLGVEIYSYNDHRSAPFSRACWLVSTTNFTRASEPTLSWNQLH
jgi:hypothetical protein